MSDVSNKSKQRNSFRRSRSIYQVHYSLKRQDDEIMAKPLILPTHSLEIQAYGMQVAGHRDSEDTKYLGLLQCNNGTILKPIIKEAQKREVDFYNRLTTSPDPDLVELAKFTAQYFGCKKFTYNGFEQDYIILEDLTQRMLEPCIMDVKIGKRTWDPLASEEKVKNEQRKYAQCKQEYGFCIPGFQVYNITTGKLLKFNKDYGKKLHGQAVRDALRNYLNGTGTNLCRALILQFLSELWKIQKWSRRQTALRLYCASLLLVYDASRLRDCCGENDILASRMRCRPPAMGRRRSIHSLHSPASMASSTSTSAFSGQLSSKGPIYKRVSSVPTSPLSAQSAFSPPPQSRVSSPWTEALDKMNHNHSFEHNYEDKLSKIRMNYRALLDQLSYESPTPNPWGTVKIIDFAHAFFNEEDEERPVDDNFRMGVDSLVEIFEAFLRETDDQVIY